MQRRREDAAKPARASIFRRPKSPVNMGRADKRRGEDEFGSGDQGLIALVLQIASVTSFMVARPPLPLPHLPIPPTPQPRLN